MQRRGHEEKDGITGMRMNPIQPVGLWVNTTHRGAADDHALDASREQTTLGLPSQARWVRCDTMRAVQCGAACWCRVLRVVATNVRQKRPCAVVLRAASPGLPCADEEGWGCVSVYRAFVVEPWTDWTEYGYLGCRCTMSGDRAREIDERYGKSDPDRRRSQKPGDVVLALLRGFLFCTWTALAGLVRSGAV